MNRIGAYFWSEKVVWNDEGDAAGGSLREHNYVYVGQDP